MQDLPDSLYRETLLSGYFSQCAAPDQGAGDAEFSAALFSPAKRRFFLQNGFPHPMPFPVLPVPSHQSSGVEPPPTLEQFDGGAFRYPSTLVSVVPVVITSGSERFVAPPSRSITPVRALS